MKIKTNSKVVYHRNSAWNMQLTIFVLTDHRSWRHHFSFLNSRARVAHTKVKSFNKKITRPFAWRKTCHIYNVIIFIPNSITREKESQTSKSLSKTWSVLNTLLTDIYVTFWKSWCLFDRRWHLQIFWSWKSKKCPPKKVDTMLSF